MQIAINLVRSKIDSTKWLAAVLCVPLLFGYEPAASAAPAPPTLGPIANHVVAEDHPTEAIRLELSDPDTPNLSLRMTGVSDNPVLVPTENIFFGVFQTWYVTVTPAFGQVGTATITVTASDGTSSASRSFTLTVNPPPPGAARFFNPSPIALAASGVASPYPSEINVVGSRGGITNMTLIMSKFSHDRVQDVNALLVGPSGQGLVVMSHVSGGGRSATNVTVFLIDSAGFALPSSFELWSEPLRPTAFLPEVVFPGLPQGVVYSPGLFSMFRGQSANGKWSLYAYDDALGAGGVIQGGWSLTISTDESGNSPPYISDIPDQSVEIATPTVAIPFTVHDPDVPSSSLTLSGRSSQPNLVPSGNIGFGGNGANRSVTVTPAPGRTGLATITVIVSDGVYTNSDTFLLAVGIVNALPTLTAIPDQTIDEDTSFGPIPFTVDDAETPAANLKLSSSSSNPALISTNQILFGGSGASRTLTAIPATNQSGSATLTVTVSDGLTNTSRNFVVVVNPVNDPPVISAITNQTTAMATPVGPIPFSIGDPETPVGNLTLAADSSNPPLIPTDHIVFGGAGANRTLTLTPLPGETGNATITVTVSDGIVTITNTFVLTVQLLPPGTVVFANPSPITIPTVGMASPYPSAITVDGVVGEISRVTVTLKHITHSWLSDVDMLLVGPNGQSAMIFSDVGTGQAVNNLTVMLSDAAPLPLAETGHIITGVFKPTNNPGEPQDLGDPFVAPAPLGPYASPLSVFNGQTANGRWSLYAVDDGPSDQGMIADGWTLMITTVSSPTITTITRVANGSIRFVGTGQSEVIYSVQASPDLAQWQPIGTTTANTSGQFEFEDTAPLPSESRFYRVVFP